MTDNEQATLERGLGRIEGRLDGIERDVADTKSELRSLSTSGFKWCAEHKQAIDELIASAKKNTNGHSKFKLGPLTITNVSATVITRLSLLAGLGWLIAKQHGWL